LGSKALVKAQSVALIAMVIVAAVVGAAGYVFWTANKPPQENFKIGICADLDNADGRGFAGCDFRLLSRLTLKAGLMEGTSL